MQAPLQHHLTERELAARWHLTEKAIQAKRARGDGPRFLKLGAAVRYRLADVEEYEAAQERQNTAQEAAA
jgi:hypothetical protein